MVPSLGPRDMAKKALLDKIETVNRKLPDITSEDLREAMTGILITFGRIAKSENAKATAEGIKIEDFVKPLQDSVQKSATLATMAERALAFSVDPKTSLDEKAAAAVHVTAASVRFKETATTAAFVLVSDLNMEAVKQH